MPWSDHHRRYARHNLQINQQLLAQCLTLEQPLHSKSLQLPFDSLLGSWNHLICIDLLWLRRLQSIFPILEELHDWPTLPDNGDSGVDLLPKQHLYSELARLKPARQQLDDLLIRWCDLLRLDDAKAIVSYGSELENSLGLDRVLQFLFDHHSYCRGHIAAVLPILGCPTSGDTYLLFDA